MSVSRRRDGVSRYTAPAEVVAEVKENGWSAVSSMRPGDVGVTCSLCVDKAKVIKWGTRHFGDGGFVVVRVIARRGKSKAVALQHFVGDAAIAPLHAAARAGCRYVKVGDTGIVLSVHPDEDLKIVGVERPPGQVFN